MKHPVTLIVCAVLLIYLGVDFAARVYVPMNIQSPEELDFSDVEQLHEGEYELSAELAEWLHREANDLALQQETQRHNEQQTQPLSGGVDLGSVRARLRAVFIRNSDAPKALAIVELQDIDGGAVERTVAVVGDNVGNYQVSQILPQQIFLVDENENEIRLLVFDPTAREVITDEPVDDTMQETAEGNDLDATLFESEDPEDTEELRRMLEKALEEQGEN